LTNNNLKIRHHPLLLTYSSIYETMCKDFESTEFVKFYGKWEETEFVRKSDIPDDILDLIHPRHDHKYIGITPGAPSEDVLKMFKVQHWIRRLPAWKEEIPSEEVTYAINYA